MSPLDQDIQAIKDRNARVEQDKAWETSWIRRSFIALITYIFAGLYMSTVNLPNPWIGAFVPTSGYILSTLSLPYIRKLWIKRLGL